MYIHEVLTNLLMKQKPVLIYLNDFEKKADSIEKYFKLFDTSQIRI